MFLFAETLHEAVARDVNATATTVLAELELYPHEQLRAELRRIRTRYGPGRASVEIPRLGGSHGDLAQALALAVFEHRNTPALQPDNPWMYVLRPR